MQDRRGGGDSSLGRNGRRPGEPIPFWPGSTTPVHSVRFQPRRPTAVTGGDSRSASYPADDVHRVLMIEGVEGWGMTFGEDKERGRMKYLASNTRPVIGKLHSLRTPFSVHKSTVILLAREKCPISASESNFRRKRATSSPRRPQKPPFTAETHSADSPTVAPLRGRSAKHSPC